MTNPGVLDERRLGCASEIRWPLEKPDNVRPSRCLSVNLTLQCPNSIIGLVLMWLDTKWVLYLCAPVIQTVNLLLLCVSWESPLLRILMIRIQRRIGGKKLANKTVPHINLDLTSFKRNWKFSCNGTDGFVMKSWQYTESSLSQVQWKTDSKKK